MSFIIKEKKELLAGTKEIDLSNLHKNPIVPKFLEQINNDFIICNACDIYGTYEERKKYAQGCPFHSQGSKRSN